MIYHRIFSATERYFLFHEFGLRRRISFLFLLKSSFLSTRSLFYALRPYPRRWDSQQVFKPNRNIPCNDTTTIEIRIISLFRSLFSSFRFTFRFGTHLSNYVDATTFRHLSRNLNIRLLAEPVGFLGEKLFHRIF